MIKFRRKKIKNTTLNDFKLSGLMDTDFRSEESFFDPEHRYPHASLSKIGPELRAKTRSV